MGSIPAEYRDNHGKFKKGNPGSAIRREETDLILTSDGIRDQLGRYLPNELRQSRSAAERSFIKKVAIQRAFKPIDAIRVMKMILDLAENANSEQVRLLAMREFLDRLIGKPLQEAKIDQVTHSTTKTMTLDLTRLSAETLKRIEQEASEGNITGSQGGDMQA